MIKNQFLKKFIPSIIRNFLGRQLTKIERLLKIIKYKKLYPNFDSYLFGLWAKNFGVSLPLTALIKLEGLCEETEPKIIYDFGSGVSTVLLAKYALNNKCQIYSFESSQKYLEKTRCDILKKYDIKNIKLLFSSPNYVGAMKNIEPFKADLVIIDGPHGERFGKESKEFFYKIITPHTVCLIDDTEDDIAHKDNNEEAKKIAEVKSLRKIDYVFGESHRYSFLMPQKLQIRN